MKRLLLLLLLLRGGKEVVGDVYETSDEEDIGASDGLGDMRCDVAQGTWTA